MKAILERTYDLADGLVIDVTGSKSESNRLLVLHALFPEFQIKNLSHSDDTVSLAKGIQETIGTVDVHHAGTAMRFLTAYFASQEGKEIILTGSARMQERPIGVLVDALRDLGADITYAKNEGYPPLSIKGKRLTKNQVAIQANVSSQYISALMLIAPSLPNGLEINLIGKITSRPYIEMTLMLMNQLGVKGTFIENTIVIPNLENPNKEPVVVESDWSSASYFYSIVALSKNLSLTIRSYKEDSLQGDSALSDLYRSLGVQTVFNKEESSITLSKLYKELPESVHFDLTKTPDIAQTIAVTCFGLGMSCELTGLHTLKIKETDRLEALKNELGKLGAQIRVTNNSLSLFSSKEITKNVAVETYHDHRMAMAFAPLALRTSLSILDSGVVSKSFPTFWEDLARMGFKMHFEE